MERLKDRHALERVARIVRLPYRPPEPPKILEHYPELSRVYHDMSPVILAWERAWAQGIELYGIEQDANAIEQLFKQKGLRKPVGYSVFTAGFIPPEGSISLGK